MKVEAAQPNKRKGCKKLIELSRFYFTDSPFRGDQ